MTSTTTNEPNDTIPSPPAVVEKVTNIHPDVVEAVEAIKEEMKEDGIPELKPLNYVFGFGSLICKRSRAITAPTLADKEAIPVQVNNVERVWAKRSKKGFTAMGVRFRKGASCNGVLLPVSEEELMKFDEREIGYDRYLIPVEDIDQVAHLAEKNHYEKMEYDNVDVLFDSADDSSNSNSSSNSNDGSENRAFIWVYVQRYDCPADENFPIVQSYLDVIFRGCLDIDKQFALDFIETTKGWSPEEVYGLGDSSDDDDDDQERTREQEEYCAALALEKEQEESKTDDNGAVWVDDREDPIYMRADPVFSEKKGELVDQLLERYIPHHFDNREPIYEEEKEES